MTRTFVQVTSDESSPGVPLWSQNQNITQVPDGETTVAIENLVAGRKYYVQTWNEDAFGNRSPSIVRVVETARPSKTIPFSFSANGYLDEGSPMRAFVKVPADVQSVSSCAVTLAFRQFMAPATAAASSGSLTSDSGGGSTTTAGGGSTSGASSSSTSGSESAHFHRYAQWATDTPGALTKRGFNVLGTTGGGINVESTSLSGGSGRDLYTEGGNTHSHGITHTHTTPDHSHATPDHTHTVPGHVHALTYGTYEETYPTSHSVTVKTYQRDSTAGTWTLMDTQTGFVEDLVDLDLTSVITGPGDWRLEVISEAGQPNSGRLGCDLYGALEVVI